MTVSADKREIAPITEADIEKTNNSIAGIEVDNSVQATEESAKLVDDRGTTEIKKDESSSDEDLYNIKNFTI